MKKEQEPKYGVNEEGQIFNRSSGEVIPDEEPVFIFRGRDKFAIAALSNYLNLLRTLQGGEEVEEEHCHAISDRIEDFTQFSRDYPECMKSPTTKRG